MSWIDVWNRVVHRATPHSTAASGDDVRKELMFHFRELVHEKLAEGLSFDEAWERSEHQFGPLHRYENECHAVRMEQRLTWRMSGVLAVLVILACCGWSLVENREVRLSDDLRLLREDLVAVRSAQTQIVAQTNRIAGDRDLTGVVRDSDRQPLPDVKVLVILKTWPDGEYHQEAFTATTGSDGQFTLPALVPVGRRYAIQVAALKDGFAFRSVYHRKLERPFEMLEPIALRLEPASHVTLVVRDEQGVPVPNAHVIPSARTALDGEEHLIYFQAADPVQYTTDAEGRVRMNCFLAGDQARVCLQLPGDDWNSREFEVSSDNQVVELASSEVTMK